MRLTKKVKNPAAECNINDHFGQKSDPNEGGGGCKVQEPVLTAVQVYTTGQNSVKGMRCSKLQVTVECEED